ncbi:MAG: hypothetical protein A2X84_11070 [Desulfuromonadaceae bacterium GWC2_58_13]|nr:MAG: hypothetical protein A2X84_11070 [Desulfuromonadaceae bacterium GWC2_58_13]
MPPVKHNKTYQPAKIVNPPAAVKVKCTKQKGTAIAVPFCFVLAVGNPGGSIRYPWLIGLDRRIVGIEMAGQTVRELGVQSRVVRRLSMTVAAAGDHPVAGMTGDTGNLGMLALASGPDSVDAGMATGAVLKFDFTLESNLQRLVDWMAGGTGFHGLVFVMPFMAFETGRDIGMLGMVARAACNQSMLAGELFNLSSRRSMAIGAVCGQAIGQNQVERRMRIGVASQTFGLIGTMRQGVTAGALGHDLRPVVTIGVICVKLLVAVLAVKLVTTALFLDGIKVGRVTLSALGHGQRHYFGLVGVGRGLDNRRRLWYGRRSRCGSHFDFRWSCDFRFGNGLHASREKRQQSQRQHQGQIPENVIPYSLHKSSLSISSFE